MFVKMLISIKPSAVLIHNFNLCMGFGNSEWKVSYFRKLRTLKNRDESFIDNGGHSTIFPQCKLELQHYPQTSIPKLLIEYYKSSTEEVSQIIPPRNWPSNIYPPCIRILWICYKFV